MKALFRVTMVVVSCVLVTMGIVSAQPRLQRDRPAESFTTEDYYVAVNDLAANMTQHDKHKQHPELNRWHDKEVYSNCVRHVVPKKCFPSLRRWFRTVTMQESGNCSVGHFYSKFQQFPMNSGRTPERIGFGYLEHEGLYLGI